ncbi:MAG: hypothetical protein KC777_08555 [Cyanobacteria bacterium HKST-UBA02]|nr:hypothetical protein [Cyanobacteria bacterium HKST-UBA02]
MLKGKVASFFDLTARLCTAYLFIFALALPVSVYLVVILLDLTGLSSVIRALDPGSSFLSGVVPLGIVSGPVYVLYLKSLLLVCRRSGDTKALAFSARELLYVFASAVVPVWLCYIFENQAGPSGPVLASVLAFFLGILVLAVTFMQFNLLEKKSFSFLESIKIVYENLIGIAIITGSLAMLGRITGYLPPLLVLQFSAAYIWCMED